MAKLPPHPTDFEFEAMKRGSWGFPSIDKPEVRAEQAQNTKEMRDAMDNEMIPYRQAFPKDYKLPAHGTEGLVCEDIAARQRMGTAKYGTTVCANPLELKQWLQHAYEEALDQAIYLKRAIQELDK